MRFSDLPRQITDTDNALYLLIEIVKAANKLKIPEMSLQAQLKKAAVRYARQSLIDIGHIDLIYDTGHPEYIGDSEHLREAAAASIFEAWWNRTLDQPEYDAYCSAIEQCRAKFPKLDEDINKRFDDKKEYIEKKREEKREEKRQARAAGGDVDRGRVFGCEIVPTASSAAEYPEPTGPDGGWGDAAATVGVRFPSEWGGAGGVKSVLCESQVVPKNDDFGGHSPW